MSEGGVALHRFTVVPPCGSLLSISSVGEERSILQPSLVSFDLGSVVPSVMPYLVSLVSLVIPFLLCAAH